MLLSLGLTTGLFVLKREIWARQILEFDKFSLKIGMLGQKKKKKNTQRSSYPSQIDEEFLSDAFVMLHIMLSHDVAVITGRLKLAPLSCVAAVT